ncbi:MAG: hypothetical protein E6I75_01090 [Chloroflexi bacterium]|nr:MAG: hypothetical protein E6I75_01090 [Chloroflexota bacterium]
MPASAEMREYFGFSEMAHPDDARQWFEGLWRRQPFEAEAVDYFRSLRLEIGTLDEPMGGGYWFADRRLVMLRGTQEEAAVNELAHAWWDSQREAQRDALMDLLRELGARPPAEYPRIAELATVYCHGIKTQKDPSSPTGYWRGMLAEDNDHETFAGFCSGVMANAAQMPPALRAFYRGFLRT